MIAKNKKKEIFLLCGVFGLSVLFRFLIADFPKIITIYPDELRYYGIAKNLMEGNGLKIGLQDTVFQKILYSVLIAPAFLIQSATSRNTIIALLNSIYMSSSVFPIYMLCKECKLNNRKTIGVVLLFFVFSDMTYTMTFMSEVVYMPVMLFAVYITYKSFLVPFSRRKIHLSVLIGITYYLLYFGKEIGLCVLLGYLSSELACNFFESKKWKEELKIILTVVVSFVGIYALLKLVCFRGLGNSYEDADMVSISAILSPYNLYYFFYSILYNLLSIIVAMAFFPFFMPILKYKKFDKPKKKFLLFVYFTLFISVAVIAYTITVREDLGKLSPRQHMRYLYPITFPILILALEDINEENERREKKYTKDWIYILGIFSGLFLFVFHGAGLGPCVDQTPLKYLDYFIDKYAYCLNNGTFKIAINIAEILVKVAMLVLLALGISFYYADVKYIKKRKFFETFVLILLIVANIGNSIICIHQFKKEYLIEKESLYELEETKRLIESLDGNILGVVGTNAETWGQFDTYLDSKNFYIVYANSLFSIMGDNNYIDLTTQKLMSKFPYISYNNLSTIDYIITEKNIITYKEGTVQDISPSEIKDFKIYKNLCTDKIYCRKCMPVEIGEVATIQDKDGVFYSQYSINDDTYTSDEQKRFLVYGPYVGLDKGKYHVEFYYECNDKINVADVVGYADVGPDPEGIYNSVPMVAGNEKAEIDIVLEEYCEDVEFRIWAEKAGITFKQLKITKLE